NRAVMHRRLSWMLVWMAVFWAAACQASRTILSFKCLYYVEKRKNSHIMQKYIVVTGGTKGIGRAIVDRFAAEGFHVITCSRHEEDLKKLKLDLEEKYTFSKVFYQATDVSAEGEMERFITYVKSLKVK